MLPERSGAPTPETIAADQLTIIRNTIAIARNHPELFGVIQSRPTALRIGLTIDDGSGRVIKVGASDAPKYVDQKILGVRNDITIDAFNPNNEPYVLYVRQLEDPDNGEMYNALSNTNTYRTGSGYFIVENKNDSRRVEALTLIKRVARGLVPISPSTSSAVFSEVDQEIRNEFTGFFDFAFQVYPS